MSVFSFKDLPSAPLIVEAVYEGGVAGNASDDPIRHLFQGVIEKLQSKGAHMNVEDMPVYQRFK